MSDIQTVEAFQTPDGETFPSIEAAREHLARTRYITRARAYAEARNLSKSATTRACNLICDYLLFEQSQAN